MKLVILAAGKGKRMGESSNHTPKPILKYKDKTLIHHKLEQLPSDINEIIITIGHLGEKIVETIGHTYDNRQNGGSIVPVTYIEQKDLLGTGHALWQCKDAIGTDSFFVLMGDDLYSKEDLQKMIDLHKNSEKAWVALVQDIPEKMSAGKCVIDENGLLTDIIEDPEGKIERNTMYTGGCLLTPEIFNLPLVKISKTEFGLPQTFIQEERHTDGVEGKRDIHAVQASYWKRITTPEDLI
jgi:NDP-sugar pyrophosphorylase family protein